MKKLLTAVIMLLCGMGFAQAEGYNRVALSYDYSGLGFNKEMDLFGANKSQTIGQNGLGLNYIHGFGVAENMFVEVGGNFDFVFGSKSLDFLDDDDMMKASYKTKDINLQVPVNYVYRFPLAEGISIDPYVGLNFKLHLVSKFKQEVSDGDYSVASDWVSVFDDSEKAMDGKDYTWNRFQMGWHIGVGVNFNKYYLGVQAGTDFIPFYSHNFNGNKAKVNTVDCKISLGYTF